MDSLKKAKDEEYKTMSSAEIQKILNYKISQASKLSDNVIRTSMSKITTSAEKNSTESSQSHLSKILQRSQNPCSNSIHNFKSENKENLSPNINFEKLSTSNCQPLSTIHESFSSASAQAIKSLQEKVKALQDDLQLSIEKEKLQRAQEDNLKIENQRLKNEYFTLQNENKKLTESTIESSKQSEMVQIECQKEVLQLKIELEKQKAEHNQVIELLKFDHARALEQIKLENNDKIQKKILEKEELFNLYKSQSEISLQDLSKKANDYYELLAKLEDENIASSKQISSLQKELSHEKQQNLMEKNELEIKLNELFVKYKMQLEITEKLEVEIKLLTQEKNSLKNGFEELATVMEGFHVDCENKITSVEKDKKNLHEKLLEVERMRLHYEQERVQILTKLDEYKYKLKESTENYETQLDECKKSKAELQKAYKKSNKIIDELRNDINQLQNAKGGTNVQSAVTFKKEINDVIRVFNEITEELISKFKKDGNNAAFVKNIIFRKNKLEQTLARLYQEDEKKKTMKVVGSCSKNFSPIVMVGSNCTLNKSKNKKLTESKFNISDLNTILTSNLPNQKEANNIFEEAPVSVIKKTLEEKKLSTPQRSSSIEAGKFNSRKNSISDMSDHKLQDEISKTEKEIENLKQQYKYLLSSGNEEGIKVDGNELQHKMNEIADDLQILSEHSLRLRRQQREILTQKSLAALKSNFI